MSGDEYFITANMSPRGYDFHADININESKLPSLNRISRLSKMLPNQIWQLGHRRNLLIRRSPILQLGGSSEEVSLGEVARRARAHKTEPE